MFVISLPMTAKVGDKLDVRINMRPAQVWWRDKDHLVIMPDDAHKIVRQEFNLAQGQMVISFTCADSDQDGSSYEIIDTPGGTIVMESLGDK